MPTFIVNTRVSTITIELDTNNPEQPVKPAYTESPTEASRIPQLKLYIRDRGGLVGNIDPDYCSPNDLHYALTTKYEPPNPFSYLEFTLETEFQPTPLPELPEGSVY